MPVTGTQQVCFSFWVRFTGRLGFSFCCVNGGRWSLPLCCLSTPSSGSSTGFIFTTGGLRWRLRIRILRQFRPAFRRRPSRVRRPLSFCRLPTKSRDPLRWTNLGRVVRPERFRRTPCAAHREPKSGSRPSESLCGKPRGPDSFSAQVWFRAVSDLGPREWRVGDWILRWKTPW